MKSKGDSLRDERRFIGKVKAILFGVNLKYVFS